MLTVDNHFGEPRIYDVLHNSTYDNPYHSPSILNRGNITINHSVPPLDKSTICFMVILPSEETGLLDIVTLERDAFVRAPDEIGSDWGILRDSLDDGVGLAVIFGVWPVLSVEESVSDV